MKKDCIFCRINSGEIPSATIFENDEFRVMLDRFPATNGHILIIPKEHVEDIYELDPLVAARMFEFATRFASILKKTFGNEGLNILQNNGKVAGQTVFHYHLHLIPRYENDSVRIGWEANSQMTSEELEEFVDKIKSNM
ncbi:MAG: HIT family protein [Epulopiscium sp.]|nr:HIT family protein [Candidatus Epulonipiscium sp.]